MVLHLTFLVPVTSRAVRRTLSAFRAWKSKWKSSRATFKVHETTHNCTITAPGRRKATPEIHEVEIQQGEKMFYSCPASSFPNRVHSLEQRDCSRGTMTKIRVSPRLLFFIGPSILLQQNLREKQFHIAQQSSRQAFRGNLKHVLRQSIGRHDHL